MSKPKHKEHESKIGSGAEFLKVFPFFSEETVAEVSRRGLFSLHNGKWRFGDRSNGSTRRLDWKKFKRSDTKGADWHKLIGIRDVVEHNRQWVVFVLEGTNDAMAAFELARRAGIMREIGVVVALGSGYRPIADELAQLTGRKLIVIGDRDNAGIESVRRVSAALCSHGVDHVVLNWNAFPNFSGKDLFDLLQSSNGEKPSWYSEVFSFFSSFFSLPQSSQFSLSSLSSLSSLFSSFICTASGQRNRNLFNLAQATKQIENARQKKFSGSELTQILDAWYAPSASFIQMGRDECLIHFLRLRDKVRFLAADLKEVMARAQSDPLPDIGIKCVPLQKVAALCRELQRAQKGHPFFLSVRTAQTFAGFVSVSAAHDALCTLESMGVIKCVKRGVPGNPGNPATRWRYLFPM
jgi:Toprim domain-containing protein